jgi:hypothetical protein
MRPSFFCFYAQTANQRPTTPVTVCPENDGGIDLARNALFGRACVRRPRTPPAIAPPETSGSHHRAESGTNSASESDGHGEGGKAARSQRGVSRDYIPGLN